MLTLHINMFSKSSINYLERVVDAFPFVWDLRVCPYCRCHFCTTLKSMLVQNMGKIFYLKNIDIKSTEHFQKINELKMKEN